ncbi:hypothetical protein Kisp01_56520 [Kineosporia sp. NBRC 101677]|uniref:ArnT family glycosyltransferase n=1 Tax=Kineosporia sp. NBRC 101677 TaxID=3032197 RepID=UPI0024A3CDEF|nr:glycosyltransferase family 87 protein [Kineosporia sp. NBRC 101677]GLY18638.1 hypothetical protein Kisp01_56520 [Kineosporia sp. NBRC 101677]
MVPPSLPDQADPQPRPALRRSSPIATGVVLVLLTIGMAVATHSVVRYRLWIVVIYVVLAVALGLWVVAGSARKPFTGSAGSFLESAQRSPLQWIGYSLAATLVLVAVIHVTMRPYTYLTPGQGWLTRWVFAAAALVLAAGIALSTLRRRLGPAYVALGLTAVGYVTAAAMLIHWDPEPKIDVWITLQQAADGMLEGKNMYAQNWTNSPGVQDAFTYLPFTALLLAPGRWLAGDVRWALTLITLLGALAVFLLGRPGRRTTESAPAEATHSPMTVRALVATGAAGLLLVLPGTATQVEQAWTEPLLMACLAGWALAVRRRQMVLAMICLALGLASKQHLAVLLPVLAVWPVFGWRRAIGTAGLAGVFVLPWFIASPSDMLHDTVTMLIDFQPLIFANTVFIAAINELSWTPPFYLTGAAVLFTLGSAIRRVHRQQPDLANVLRWAAMVLLVANLVNKQAFYNQYWLVAALIVISLAAARYPAAEESGPDADTDSEAVEPVPQGS